jgi:hypothetical protein
MKTIIQILTFADKVRKASVAFYLSAAPYVAILATADLTTVQGVIGAAIVVAQTAGVYAVVNRPPGPVPTP